MTEDFKNYYKVLKQDKKWG